MCSGFEARDHVQTRTLVTGDVIVGRVLYRRNLFPGPEAIAKAVRQSAATRYVYRGQLFGYADTEPRARSNMLTLASLKDGADCCFSLSLLLLLLFRREQFFKFIPNVTLFLFQI